MSKSIKLGAQRVYELSTVIDAISPKELSVLKDIRLSAGIVKDLQNSCKEFSDKSNDLSVKQQQILRKYQEELQPKIKDLAKEDQDKLLNETNVKFQAEINEKYGEEFKAMQEAGKAECTIELSDEKYEKLKDLFNKFAIQQYTKKDALLEVASALEIE